MIPFLTQSELSLLLAASLLAAAWMLMRDIRDGRRSKARTRLGRADRISRL